MNIQSVIRVARQIEWLSRSFTFSLFVFRLQFLFFRVHHDDLLSTFMPGQAKPMQISSLRVTLTKRTLICLLNNLLNTFRWTVFANEDNFRHFQHKNPLRHWTNVLLIIYQLRMVREAARKTLSAAFPFPRRLSNDQTALTWLHTRFVMKKNVSEENYVVLTQQLIAQW